jgi:hypothetical protein
MLSKIIIIIIIIILFYIVISLNIETFISDKNYINNNEYSWERNKIYSSLPYDITIKNDKNNYYDFGNDELEQKLADIFEINYIKVIKMIEGIKWSKWKLSKESKNKNLLNNYYNKFLVYFTDKITNIIFDIYDTNNKYMIYNNSLIKYKYNINNEDILLLDIEIVIYRNNRPLAKHLKIFVITNGIYFNVIMAKVIGVIKECDLRKNYLSYNEINNNYKEYEPDYIHKYNMNSYIYDTNEKLEHSLIEYNLYNKLLKDI